MWRHHLYVSMSTFYYWFIIVMLLLRLCFFFFLKFWLHLTTMSSDVVQLFPPLPLTTLLILKVCVFFRRGNERNLDTWPHSQWSKGLYWAFSGLFCFCRWFEKPILHFVVSWCGGEKLKEGCVCVFVSACINVPLVFDLGVFQAKLSQWVSGKPPSGRAPRSCFARRMKP